jgi:hypothetical protein
MTHDARLGGNWASLEARLFDQLHGAQLDPLYTLALRPHVDPTDSQASHPGRIRGQRDAAERTEDVGPLPWLRSSTRPLGWIAFLVAVLARLK